MMEVGLPTEGMSVGSHFNAFKKRVRGFIWQSNYGLAPVLSHVGSSSSVFPLKVQSS